MPKSFADRGQTKYSSQDGNFKLGQTVLKSCGIQAVLKKISYIKNHLAVLLSCIFIKIGGNLYWSHALADTNPSCLL